MALESSQARHSGPARSECLAGCGKPATANLCPDCTAELTSALATIPNREADEHGSPQRGLAAELELTISRQYRFGTHSIGVRTESAHDPLPFHEDAAEVRDVLGNTITTWARDVAELHPNLHPPAGAVTACAAWLSGLAPLLAAHPAAGELHDEITHVVRLVRVAIDRAPELTYLGPCGRECASDLYAPAGRAILACPGCGTEHDVSKRRAWLLELTADQLLTAAEISRALPALLAQPVTASMVRGYASRGRILPHGRDHAGHSRYRLGDVLEQAVRARLSA